MNYVLRALHIEAGKHEVVLSFFPQSVKTTETLAYVALAILLLLIVLVVVLQVRKKKAN